MRLTERDRDVLLSIYFHRCLTTDQIAEMHFRYRSDNPTVENSQSAVIARRRLRKMFDQKLIERFFIDVGENNGSSPGHIVLDTLGAHVVAGLVNCTFDELAWQYEMNEVKLPYLRHMVEINDAYLYFLHCARALSHEMGDFRVENLTRHEFRYWGEKKILRPDAYGQYFTGDDGLHFFLELDRGTETPAQFQRKHQRYAAFYDSNEYLRHYDTFPLILTIAPTWERAVALRSAIYAVDKTDIRWLFTCDDLAKSNVVGPIWIGKENEPIALA